MCAVCVGLRARFPSVSFLINIFIQTSIETGSLDQIKEHEIGFF